MVTDTEPDFISSLWLLLIEENAHFKVGKALSPGERKAVSSPDTVSPAVMCPLSAWTVVTHHQNRECEKGAHPHSVALHILHWVVMLLIVDLHVENGRIALAKVFHNWNDADTNLTGYLASRSVFFPICQEESGKNMYLSLLISV